jgi:hypothetical protein
MRSIGLPLLTATVETAVSGDPPAPKGFVQFPVSQTAKWTGNLRNGAGFRKVARAIISSAVEPTESAPPSRHQPKSSDEPMLYCPVCSLRLEERKCKLFCPQCGYYMSCADY